MATTVQLSNDQLDTLYVALRIAQADSKLRGKKAQELLDFVEGQSPRTRSQLEYHRKNERRFTELADYFKKLRGQ